MGGVYERECYVTYGVYGSSPYPHASPHRIHTHLLKPATDKYGGNVVDRLLELVSGLLIDWE
jgi:hypothetical protein